jgi:hypothetical protein
MCDVLNDRPALCFLDGATPVFSPFPQFFAINPWSIA